MTKKPLQRLIVFRAEEVFADTNGDYIHAAELEDWIEAYRAAGELSADEILDELLLIVK